MVAVGWAATPRGGRGFGPPLDHASGGVRPQPAATMFFIL
jgi:hypothetical protein